MDNFVATLFNLTSPANYYFQKICVKSTFTLIIYSNVIFSNEAMLSVLALPQTTDVNKIAGRNFLGFFALAVFNSTLPDNLLMYGQPNAEAFCELL